MKTTRNRRNTCKRVLAMLTALTMSFSMLQSVAFASEGEDTTSSNPEITVIAVDGTSDETSAPGPADDTGGAEPAVPGEDDGISDPSIGNTGSDTEDTGTAEDTEGTGTTEDTGTAEDTEDTEDTGEDVNNTESSEPWDITKTERPGASEDVSADIGTSSDKLNLEDKNWDIFYDADNDVYKITFNIGSEAEAATQTIDLTYALKLLGKYAETGKQELEDAKNKIEEPVMGDVGKEPVLEDIGEAPVEPEKPVAPDAPVKPEEPVAPVEPGKPEDLDENLDIAYEDIVTNVARDPEGEPDQNFDYAAIIAEKTGLSKDDPFVKESAAYMYDQAMVDWVMDNWSKWKADGHMYANYFGDPDTMLYYGCGISVKWPDGANQGTPVLKQPAPEYEVDKSSDAYKAYEEALAGYADKFTEYQAQLAEYEAAQEQFEKEHGVDSPEYQAYLAEMEKYQSALDAYNTAKAEAEAAYAEALEEYNANKAEIEAKYANDKAAYDKAIADLKAEFDRRIGADVLEPGDVKKFELYLTSDSKHTYKYQSGSFTLATPDMGEFMAGLKELWENDPEEYERRYKMPDGRWLIDPNNLGMSDGVTGFDGQILPDEYVDVHDYHVTMTAGPMQDLFDKIGMTDPKNPLNQNNILGDGRVGLDYDGNGNVTGYPSYWESEITKFLNGYEGETIAEKLNAYLLDYYNSKDGTSYATVDELIKNNPSAQEQLTKTTTSGNKWFTLGGEKFVVDAHLETVKYDTFYKQLFSFAFGDEADIDAILKGAHFNTETNRWEYENNSWTDNGYQNALYYYMDHQEIWEKTDKYFQTLLSGGLSVDQATWTSLMMALNIDGELTGNDWQDTMWPWYSSIQLERMDIDFNLTKKDGETGETITSSETEFQVYYIDKVKNEDGTETDVKMYCTANTDDDGNISYTFVTTPSTIWTTGGELNIDYAMMKDIVYYLQEITAPEGYEVDTNVYIVMDEEDYNKLTDEDRAALEGTFDEFLNLDKSEDGLTVTTDFVNVKIVTNPDPDPTPTPDPTPDPDPDPDPTPDPTPDPDPDPTPDPDPDPDPTPDPDPDPDPTPDPDPDPDPTPTPPDTVQSQLPPPNAPATPDVPDVTIPDVGVPLTDAPEAEEPVEELMEIPEEEVPLANPDVPKTGDISGIWYTMTFLAAAGLVFITILARKNQEEAQEN